MKHASANERIRKPITLAEARSAALLYYLPDEETYKKAETLVSQLAEMGIKTRVACYSDLKISPHYFIPKISQDIVMVKDLNWCLQPKKTFVKEFIDTEFDILIDLSLKEHLPLLYLASLSKAVLKVGRYQEDYELFYDLMIHTSDDETIDSFAEQVLHYLGKINI